MTWVKQKDIDRGCPACGALRGCQPSEDGLRSCVSIVASAELREVRAQLAAMESEREFCLRAMKAAGEKHAAELAAVTEERDEALAGERFAIEKLMEEGGENARLRAAIAPTPGNVRIVASHLPWSAEISVCQGEEYAVEILRAIAARVGVKP